MADIDLSKKELIEGYKRGERALDRAKTYKEQLAEGVRQIAYAGESFVIGTGLGVVKGYYGGVKLMSVPLDLVASAAFHGAALALDSDTAKHAHNMGNAALGSFGSTFGAGLGVKLKQKIEAKKNGTPTMTGASPAAMGSGARVYSDAELAAMGAAA